MPRNLRESGAGYGKSRSSAANDDPLLKVLLDIKDNSNFRMEQVRSIFQINDILIFVFRVLPGTSRKAKNRRSKM